MNEPLKCPHCEEEIPIALLTAYIGRLGGSKTSEAKKLSSRANGLKGGKPPTHGMTKRPEYLAWMNAKSRCNNPKNKAWSYYGGRGISMCEEWVDDFLSFYEHVGPKPSPEHSLDRIDNDGNYEPGNLRWATKKEQSANRRCSPRHE